jgi:hypothetical protein
MPTAATFGHIPAIIAPHVFHAHLAINGEERWIVSRVGSYARDEIGVGDGRPIDVGDKRMAVRLRKLFELVAERNEPYSVMFEAVARTDERRLVEVYAAPLATHETREHHIFAAINSRSEAAR